MRAAVESTLAQQIEDAMGEPITAAAVSEFDPGKSAHVDRPVPWADLRARLDVTFDPNRGLRGVNGFGPLDAVPTVTVWSQSRVGVLVDVTGGYDHEHSFDVVILDRNPPSAP